MGYDIIRHIALHRTRALNSKHLTNSSKIRISPCTERFAGGVLELQRPDVRDIESSDSLFASLAELIRVEEFSLCSGATAGMFGYRSRIHCGLDINSAAPGYRTSCSRKCQCCLHPRIHREARLFDGCKR